MKIPEEFFGTLFSGGFGITLSYWRFVISLLRVLAAFGTSVKGLVKEPKEPSGKVFTVYSDTTLGVLLSEV